MRKGFSLIELLLSLSLVAILAGIGLATTLKSNEQKKVTETAETVRQYFMQAKSMALAGRKDCLACGSTSDVCGNGDVPLDGWRIRITAGTGALGTYEMHGECGPVIFFPSGIKNMPDNVILSNMGSGNILFKPINKGTNLNNPTTIRISSTVTGLINKSFTISEQGEISSIF